MQVGLAKWLGKGLVWACWDALLGSPVHCYVSSATWLPEGTSGRLCVWEQQVTGGGVSAQLCRLQPGQVGELPITSLSQEFSLGAGVLRKACSHQLHNFQETEPTSWLLAMAVLGHVRCQSHHHSHIESCAHSNGECGQEESPAGGGAGQAEVPFGDGLAGLGEMGW